MPGMFGMVGFSVDTRRRLAAAFRVGAHPAVTINGPDVLLGAHAHGDAVGIAEVGEDIIAVDGEVSLYRSLPARAATLFRLDEDGVAITPDCRGNLAIWESQRRRLSIGGEWAGTFPLYFVHRPGEGFAFSSAARPLAQLFRPAPDPLAIAQFLQYAYYVSDRSQWQGIRRLMPGQALRYERDRDALHISERSRLWASQTSERLAPQEMAADCWERVGSAIAASDDGRQNVTIMSSGGWDSRTVLARSASLIPPERLLGYSHGDTRSREVRIAQQLVGSLGIAFHQEPIDARAYETAAFHDGFDGEEHVMFPHWLRAGRIAAAMGGRVITSGLFGEIMGGHYGRGMLLTGNTQIRAVLESLLGSKGPAPDATPAEIATIVNFLSIPQAARPWVIREDWWAAAGVTTESWNATIESDVARLRARGVHTVNQLVEAYVAEHRGAQYGNAQIRATRRYVDVTVPLADRRVLEWTTQLPLNSKIHNRANRATLLAFAPALLRYPMAATLADARRPLLVQEVSRFARKTFEASRRRWQMATRAPVVAPRLSWVNFDFLRRGPELRAFLEDLQGDFWDRAAIARHIDETVRGSAVSTHSTSDHLLKVYTIDLGLRGT
jgi:asparagine synthetase B (glutamine-hydrolysing)